MQLNIQLSEENTDARIEGSSNCLVTFWQADAMRSTRGKAPFARRSSNVESQGCRTYRVASSVFHAVPGRGHRMPVWAKMLTDWSQNFLTEFCAD